ncbi:hypothetical protein [Phytopseudomonas dryadis]|uniref:hypothetical protein n=1 Tax=Pseudomonadaceae TaxID=135621 RepID=UPI0010376B9A|nr:MULTISPECIES: hypothetical protein [Pseudomonas]
MTADVISNSSNSAQEAKELTRKLLSAMSIARVINVDDDHHQESEQNPETVVAALRAQTLDYVLVARALLSDQEDDQLDDFEADEVIDLLHERWVSLDIERRKELTLAANRSQNSNRQDGGDLSSSIDDNNAALIALPELIGDVAEFKKMSFGDWRTQGQELLKDPIPTLVLFDRSFEREQQSATAGEDLVKDILRRDDLRHIYVGLLTYTAANTALEAEIAQNITTELGEKARSIIVIAKHRLNSGSEFPEALRMVLYADELESFRHHAIESLITANETATNFLRTVKPYALMATFESARREGMYEAENVIRMANAPARRMLEAQLRDASFVSQVLSKLRNAAGVELYLNGTEKPSDLNKITWQERFDDKNHLASLSMPLSIGDIFRVFDVANPTGVSRYYILLAQSCDLSVRSDGKRSNNVNSFVLTQIKPAIKSTESGKYSPLKSNQQELGYFDAASDAPWRVCFSQKIHVPALALDACVINSSGLGKIGVNNERPANLAASWVSRRERMIEEAQKLIAKYQRLEQSVAEVQGRGKDAQDMKKILAASLVGAGVQHSTGLTAKIDTALSTIEYGIERFARIADSAANGLLALSANHQARPALYNNLFHDQVDVG